MITPLSASEKAQAQKVYCSVAKTDADRCVATYFEMDPRAAMTNKQEKERRNANNFAREVNTKKEAHIRSIRNNIENMNKISASYESLQSQLLSLQKQKQKLTNEKDNLEQSIRANRRRFLDNNPQQGTPSILGLRTSDDKILLFFWIGLVLFANIGVFTFYSLTNKSHVPIVYIGVTIIVLIVAYLIVYNATRIEYKFRPTTL